MNTQVDISKDLTPRVIVLTRDSLPAIERVTLRRWYETNRIVVVDDVISNVRPFHEFTASSGRDFKKLKLNSEINPKLLKGIRPGQKIRVLSERLREAYHSLMGILNLWGYKPDLKHITARFQVSRKEGLHIDAYSSFQLRRSVMTAYLNLDDEPRIWDTSHSMDELIENEEFLKKSNVDGLRFQLGRVINKSMAKESFPRTTINIAPGAAVITNGATVAHEIVFGKRMLAVSLCFKTKHLDDDSGSYLRIFQRFARRRREAQRYVCTP